MDHDHEPKKRGLFDRFFAYLDARFPSDRLIIYLLLIVCIGASAIALLTLNNAYTTSVPASGGTLTEGIVGTPRFVNPALAITRTDKDLTALVYSGLMKLNTNGELVPDLAKSVTVSDDGLVYNVVLREDIEFHDGTSITAGDVAFTIELIQDPDLKSPLRGDWNGVTVEVIGEHEVNFVLEDAYTPFKENLTVGIMPKHVWGSLSIEALPFSQHNTAPIGSGPYRLANDSRDKAGLINGYILKAFENAQNEPRIDTLAVKFFQNEAALRTAYENDEITSTSGFSYDTLHAISDRNDIELTTEPLPRIFSVFFNQNNSIVLRDQGAREALNAAIDRTELITEVLHGYGEPADSPVPPGFLKEELADLHELENNTGTSTPIEYAQHLLAEHGWEQNEAGRWVKDIDGNEVPLRITIATANSSVFEETAYYLEHQWNELGVEVSVELYEQSDLVQTVIRPRDYEALLFGTEIGRALDLYPFWHSSQREDPGLNVALYANITTDSLLETARTTQDETERVESIRSFAQEIMSEKPALFLYSPYFVYTTKPGVETAAMDGIEDPSERFSNIDEWYLDEEDVWHMFVN